MFSEPNKIILKKTNDTVKKWHWITSFLTHCVLRIRFSISGNFTCLRKKMLLPIAIHREFEERQHAASQRAHGKSSCKTLGTEEMKHEYVLSLHLHSSCLYGLDLHLNLQMTIKTVCMFSSLFCIFQFILSMHSCRFAVRDCYSGWYLQVLLVSISVPLVHWLPFCSAMKPWRGDGLASEGLVKSRLWGMKCFLFSSWLQVKCFWDLFSDFRVSLSISGNDLRCGRRKQARASLTVSGLSTTSQPQWEALPGGAFSGECHCVERGWFWGQTAWGLNLAPLFKNSVTLEFS